MNKLWSLVEKIKDIFFSLDKKQQISLGFIVFILISLPIILFAIQYQKNIRSKALESDERLIDNEQRNILSKDLQYAKDRIILKYQKGYSLNVIENTYEELKQYDIASQDKLFRSLDEPKLNDYYLIRFKKPQDIPTIIQNLQRNKSLYIELAIPDYKGKFLSVPSDPLYINNFQSGLNKIGMDKIWDLPRNNNQVLVAVIDSGIDRTHEDFQGVNILSGINIDNWDRYIDPTTEDREGHGTAVASIIGAKLNNLGLASFNQNLNIIILPIKVHTEFIPEWFVSSVAEGIALAARASQARVINMSLSIPIPCDNAYVAPIKDAIASALGTHFIRPLRPVIVAGAGNDNMDSRSYTPASCQGVLTVGGTDISDNRAIFNDFTGKASNYGSFVKIAAPATGVMLVGAKAAKAADRYGAVIINDYPKYFFFGGTSGAAPMVSGAASMLLAQDPNMTPEQVQKCLINNADYNTPSVNEVGPRLNVYKALQAAINHDSSCY